MSALSDRVSDRVSPVLIWAPELLIAAALLAIGLLMSVIWLCPLALVPLALIARGERAWQRRAQAAREADAAAMLQRLIERAAELPESVTTELSDVAVQAGEAA